MTTPRATALAFTEAINGRDPDAIAALMTEDHTFIDSLGRVVKGRETMRAGWRGYYGMCPDYSVNVTEGFENQNVVAMFGMASGTIRGVAWQTPCAWRAEIEDGLVREWRVYADNKPVYDILAR